MEELINKEALLDRVEDDAELLEELVEIFQEDYPELLANLREALDRGDASATRDAAHGLKGLLGNFTQGPIYRVTAELEAAARCNELSDGTAKAAEIEAHLEELFPALESVLAELRRSVPEKQEAAVTKIGMEITPSEATRLEAAAPESVRSESALTAIELPGIKAPKRPRSQLVVFTDIDSCLLNDDGDVDPQSVETLEQLRDAGVPVIFVTSRTAAEVEVLQRDLALETPYICENGALIHFHGTAGNEAEERDITFGTPYGVLRRFVESRCHELLIRGFGDLEPEELAALTGLDFRAALRARDRRFTEPLLCEPSVLSLLRRRAHAQGFQVVDGGRFIHLMGSGHDKGSATRYLRSYLESQYGPVVLVAAGDSEVDVPMLYEADQPIVVQRFVTPSPLFVPGAWTSSEAHGCSAWNALIRRALEEHGEGRLTHREPEPGRQAA